MRHSVEYNRRVKQREQKLIATLCSYGRGTRGAEEKGCPLPKPLPIGEENIANNTAHINKKRWQTDSDRQTDMTVSYQTQTRQTDGNVRRDHSMNFGTGVRR